MRESEVARQIKPYVLGWLDRVLAQGGRDLGTALTPFSAIYADSITVDTLAGTMAGQKWEYLSGDMTIDAKNASDRTVYVLNSGAGQADLNVQRNIVVGGTVDGVDVGAFKGAYDAHAADVAAHGATGAVVGTTNTQTLSNKTLTSPVISTIVNTGTLTLPTSTDTLVGRATTDTLSNKTLTTPTIGSFVNATHNHSNAVGGGTISHSVLTNLSADDHTHYLLATGARTGATSQVQAFTNGVRTTLIDTASGNLTLTPSGYVVLSDGKALRSSSFTSGFAGSGWRLLDAKLELDSLLVRGTMSVYELLINQIRATNGSLFVSSSGKIASVSGSGPYTLGTDGDHGFAVGDLIRAQRFTGTGVYQSNMQVTAVGSTTQFTASLSSGDTPAVGMEFVRLGSTSDTNRRGAIYLTADDSHAPFMDITDGVASFADWNGGTKTKVRLGRLTGISDSVLSPTGYGLWSDNAYLKGEISVANDVVRLDSTGIRILMPATTWASQNALRFVDGSAVELGGLYGYTTSTTNHTIGVRAIGTATRRPAAYVLAEGTGSGAPGAGLVYLAASNAVGSKTANITLDAGTPSSVVIGGADVVALSGVQNHVYTLLRPPTDLSADLGTASFRFGTLYVNQIIATSVSGATMDGQTWTYPGSMVIDAVSSGNTTVSITNSGAGQADLNVQRNIIVGGTVDGVDISVHNAATAAHGASGAVVGTTNTQTLSNKTLTTPTIGDFTNAQHNHADAAGGGTISYANLTSRSHALVGADHTASGLTTGHVIRASGATTFAWAQLAHSDLSGIGTNTHTAIDTHIATGDIHVAHSGVTLTAGDGLTGGGTIAASRTFTLGTPSSLTSTSTNAVTATSHTHVIDSTIARSAIQIVAGAGLTGGGDLTTNRTLNVGAGTMITVNADDVAITAGANYQFIGTGSGTAAGWRNVSELAGAGLVAALGALAVGAGAGITINADDVALTTPGSLSVSSPNNSAGSHTHVVTTSSNPGAAAAILASTSGGALTLVEMIATTRLRSPLLDTASGNLAINPQSQKAVFSSFTYIDGAGKTVGIGIDPSGAATLDVQAVNNDDHTIRVKQKSGQTGRLWRIENMSGQELIVLDSVGNLQSGNPGFVSGLTGWQVTPTGNAEFNNITARGEFHASIFVMDEFHATGGTNVTATAGSLLVDADLNTNGRPAIRNVRTTAFVQDYIDYRSTAISGAGLTARTYGNYIDIKDPYSGHASIFAYGDTVRVKTFTGSAVKDIWMTVHNVTNMTTFYRYFVTVRSGTLPATLPAGSAVIRYGQTGNGLILQTADLAYGPYMDILTVGPEPWTGAAGSIIPHVRLGRLDGVGLPGISGVEQYGLVGGADLSNANSPYFVLSNLQQKMYRIDSEWHNGTNPTVRISSSGVVRMGTDVGGDSTTGFKFDPATGDLQIGNASYPGTVTIYGSITITNTIPSGSVSGLGALATLNSVDLTTGQVTNKSLANLDSTANTKLSGIEAGATVGAAWGTNLTGRPVELTDGRVATALNASGTVVTKVVPTSVAGPSSSGLYLGSDYLGFYNGSAWRTYMSNAGHFYLTGNSGNALAWDGTTLSVEGNITVTNTIPNNKISGLGSLATLSAVGASNLDTTVISGGKIVTGLLTASNIQTGTLDASVVTVTNLNASNITTGTLSADRIGAGSISTAKLSATAIDGMTITGSTIQTATSGNRIVLNTSALQARNSSDVLVAEMLVSGALRLGTNLGASATTFFYASPFNNTLWLGNTNAGHLEWNGSDGRLNFKDGSIVRSYVDTAGRFKIGQGTVTLDDDGITLTPGSSVYNEIAWRSGANLIAKVSVLASGDNQIHMQSRQVSSDDTLIAGFEIAKSNGVYIGDIGTIYDGASRSYVRAREYSTGSLKSYIEAIFSGGVPSISLWTAAGGVIGMTGDVDITGDAFVYGDLRADNVINFRSTAA